MFDPDDKKRTVVRRSLLDLSVAEVEPSRRVVRAAPGQNATSLLDQLCSSTAEPQALRDQQERPLHPPAAAVVSAGAMGRIAKWFNRADGTGEPGAESRLDVAPAKLPSLEDQASRPLIDITTILASVWQLRKLILALALAGTVGGVLVAMSTPSTYVAESKLYVDPREVRLTESDLSKESLATEAILALVDSQLEVLRSRTVLETVAVDLGLDRDPEFGGKAAGNGGLAAGVAVVRDIVSPGKGQPAPASGVNPHTLENLSDAVTVGRDPKTFIVTVQVKSRDPAKSALIANRLVTTFLAEEKSAQADFFQRTTAALDNQLEGLRKDLEVAENAVEKYKADHDIIGASGELISDKQLLSLNDQVGAVRSRIAEARAKVDVAAKTRPNDVLTGAFPEELNSVTLQELRKQFSGARAQLSALEASLGPRHPQRLAAVQSLEAARLEIGNELRRIEAAAQTELQRAIRTEKDLLQQLAVGKAEQVNASAGFVELRELERKANTTRIIYETFLKRASETGQEEKLSSKNIRVISVAEPPLQPAGPSRKFITVGGLIAGLMAGIGLGVLLGTYRSLRDLLRRPARVAPVVPQADPPGQGSDPIDPRPTRRRVEQPAPSPVLRPVRMPSAHHAAAAEAALSAVPQHDDVAPVAHETGAGSQDMGGIAQVHEDLRALRSRVEYYAALRAAGHR